MTNTQLITAEDFKPHRPLPDSIDREKRIMPYIQEAQEVELAQLLGRKFYHDLMNNPGNYQELINGEDYTYDGATIHYEGLKPILVYYAYSRFILAQQITITQFGVVNKTNDYSSQISEKTIGRMSAEARSMAKKYEQDMILYLDTKGVTVYPLWTVACSKTTKTRGSFKITKI